MSSEIVHAAQRVLALRRLQSPPEAEWERACASLESAISTTRNAEQLRAGLDQDLEDLLLPSELKSAMYERLLVLDGRNPATLREYAWHLQLYGPDKDEEAELLVAEALRGEMVGSPGKSVG